MQAAAQAFFAAPRFAVAGASSNPTKFGNKLFAWYASRGLEVEALNPAASEIEVAGKTYPAIASPSALSDPSATALSIVTPPKVTAALLREAKDAGVAAVWLQPGAFTQAELEFALKEFPGKAVAGFEGGTQGAEGWCVLVDGDEAIRASGRQEKL